MKVCSVFTFVIVCLFVANTETKDFCKAFRENGNQIDYSFDFIYDHKIEEKLLLIIGNNYWLIEEPKDSEQQIKLVSNESQLNTLFSGDYSLAFSVEKQSKYIYGFLKKNDLSIDWKNFTFAGNPSLLNITSVTHLKTTSNPFKSGFKPSLAFWSGGQTKGGFVFGISRTKITFVSQKRLADTTGDVFQREYISLIFKNGFDNITVGDDIKGGWTKGYVSSSSGQNNIIGLMGFIYDEPNGVANMILILINQTIEYCHQILNHLKPTASIDQKCLLGRRVLIDCKESAKEEPKPCPSTGVTVFMILTVILLLMLGMVVMSLSYQCCTNFKAIKNWFTRKREEPLQQMSRQPSVGYTVRNAVDNTTVETVDSRSGVPLKLLTKPKISGSPVRSSAGTSGQTNPMVPKKPSKPQKSVSPKTSKPKK